ncbi:MULTISPECIES: DUF922 domain-containing protein [unclassified Sphingomonas]|uniref:DUF922 domain-containing protein n=1 Tax=unclassified Sphingomonas TaxID=196159 RepID=UPI0006F3ECA9|nr:MULTISPECIES: DUF922 domain-containing protein [unclassified Sphingomonas]KQX20122.1 Zn-dependent protease [Sphingomonas sp. Root1294]KQY67372.1 Zn-dependent protease [Sphingomonas sp. Root50]KRB90750.1 Zn-dependent protease [Sphingomonas sp. Root720]
MILSLGLAITAATSADVPASSPFAGMPNVIFQYYDVEGRTPAEIYQSMRARAPQTDDGDGVARTAWHIRAGWRQSRRGDDCEVADPMTSLSITVVLPRLATTEGVTPEALDYWERTMRGLEIHEAGHARIAIDHRRDFVTAAAEASCGSIKDVARRTQERIEEIQEDYDRRTRHGITQIPGAGE